MNPGCRRAALSVCLAAAMMALANCGGFTPLEAARLACTVAMQMRWQPVSDQEPARFEPVPNIATDPEKFEFVWKQSQIKNVLFSLTMEEITRTDQILDDAPRSYTVVIEASGKEREYICRGSLKARALHGVWMRQTFAGGQQKEIKITKYPVDF
jgi:hypothetical protein